MGDKISKKKLHESSSTKDELNESSNNKKNNIISPSTEYTPFKSQNHSNKIDEKKSKKHRRKYIFFPSPKNILSKSPNIRKNKSKRKKAKKKKNKEKGREEDDLNNGNEEVKNISVKPETPHTATTTTSTEDCRSKFDKNEIDNSKSKSYSSSIFSQISDVSLSSQDFKTSQNTFSSTNEEKSLNESISNGKFCSKINQINSNIIINTNRCSISNKNRISFSKTKFSNTNDKNDSRTKGSSFDKTSSDIICGIQSHPFISQLKSNLSKKKLIESNDNNEYSNESDLSKQKEIIKPGKCNEYSDVCPNSAFSSSPTISASTTTNRSYDNNYLKIQLNVQRKLIKKLQKTIRSHNRKKYVTHGNNRFLENSLVELGVPAAELYSFIANLISEKEKLICEKQELINQIAYLETYQASLALDCESIFQESQKILRKYINLLRNTNNIKDDDLYSSFSSNRKQIGSIDTNDSETFQSYSNIDSLDCTNTNINFVDINNYDKLQDLFK